MRLTVELPSTTPTRPPLLLRIRLIFRRLVSEPFRQAVEAVVAKALRRPAVSRAGGAAERTAEDIMFDIKRDLKSMQAPGAEDVDVQIELPGDWGDFFVAGLQEARRHDRSSD